MDMLHSLFPDINFPEEELSYVMKNIVGTTISKGDFFVTAETVCDKIGLVNKGILRSYVTIDDKEFNIEFYSEGQFVSAFTSFLTHAKTEWVIQALEDTDLFVISSQLLNELYTRHPCWTIFGKRIFEIQTVKKCAREKSLLRDDATSRYKLFREQYLHIENRLPLLHIASYIGIQPETLSRIRKSYFS